MIDLSKKAAGGEGKRSLLGGLKGRSAASLFYEELPEEHQPKSGNRALEVALIWGDAIIEATQFDGGAVKIGGADTNHFQVYLEGVEGHQLATLSGDSANLTAPAGGSIVVRRGGKDENEVRLRDMLYAPSGLVSSPSSVTSLKSTTVFFL